MTSRLLCAGALITMLAVPVAAQVRIQVVDEQARPIPSVRIDALGRGELIEVASTSTEGLVELNAERWEEVRRITLTHLGFQTLIVQVADIPTDGVIRLERELDAVAIDGVTVQARSLCPIDDEPRARTMWTEIASRYSTETGSRAWFAYLSRYGGSVPQNELLRVPDARLIRQIAGGGPGVLHVRDLTGYPLDALIQAEGYAWEPLVIGGTLRLRDRAWAYAELDWIHAYHFASPVFGALHDFAVTSEAEEQVTLTFCGRGEETGGALTGVLTLVPGDVFLSAEWRFATDERNEDAGGSVTFTNYLEAAGAQPHLVAAQGVFFRRLSPADPTLNQPPTYSRFGTTRIRWYLLPSGDRPCNTGISFYGDPPRTPEGVRFTECVAEHWGSW